MQERGRESVCRREGEGESKGEDENESDANGEGRSHSNLPHCRCHHHHPLNPSGWPSMRLQQELCADALASDSFELCITTRLIRQKESNCNHLSVSPRLGPGVRFVSSTAKFEMCSLCEILGLLHFGIGWVQLGLRPFAQF